MITAVLLFFVWFLALGARLSETFSHWVICIIVAFIAWWSGGFSLSMLGLTVGAFLLGVFMERVFDFARYCFEHRWFRWMCAVAIVLGSWVLFGISAAVIVVTVGFLLYLLFLKLGEKVAPMFE